MRLFRRAGVNRLFFIFGFSLATPVERDIVEYNFDIFSGNKAVIVKIVSKTCIILLFIMRYKVFFTKIQAAFNIEKVLALTC